MCIRDSDQLASPIGDEQWRVGFHALTLALARARGQGRRSLRGCPMACRRTPPDRGDRALRHPPTVPMADAPDLAPGRTSGQRSGCDPPGAIGFGPPGRVEVQMARTRVVIMGAAGRDFHDFNVVYRNDPDFEVVAFTATQIPGIADRRYPAVLAGSLYPRGIP